MTIIQTKDFILRPLKLSDAEPYFEVMQDEETIKNLNSVPSNLEEAKQEIKDSLEEKYSEYFTIEGDRNYAGNVILQHQDYDPNSDEGRIHLWMHPKYRRKGLATKALKELIQYGFQKGFKRIFAQCKAVNTGVITILKKLGFTEVKRFVNEFGVKKVLWVKEK